jgi:hypothetical protein
MASNKIRVTTVISLLNPSKWISVHLLYPIIFAIEFDFVRNPGLLHLTSPRDCTLTRRLRYDEKGGQHQSEKKTSSDERENQCCPREYRFILLGEKQRVDLKKIEL